MRILAWTYMALVVGVLPATAQPAPREPLVFAAASLKTALDAVIADWRRQGGGGARMSYAGSPALVRQIENGAPADVLFLADTDWMNYSVGKGLVDKATRRNLLGNSLVLVAAKGAEPVDLKDHVAFLARLGSGRLAVGETQSVPAGRYAKAALEYLGLWQQVQGRLAPMDNVRAALTLTVRGEATLGIVYATDARAEPGVSVVARFPEASHPAILYPVARVSGSRNALAEALMAWLVSPSARQVFEAEGFVVLP